MAVFIMEYLVLFFAIRLLPYLIFLFAYFLMSS